MAAGHGPHQPGPEEQGPVLSGPAEDVGASRDESSELPGTIPPLSRESRSTRADGPIAPPTTTSSLLASIGVAAPPPARIWAIASGKGGVGRSFFTANLGCIVARDEGPVTLVDLDPHGGNLHTLLGQSAEPISVPDPTSPRTPGGGLSLRTGDIPGLYWLSFGGLSPTDGSSDPAEPVAPMIGREPMEALLQTLRTGRTPWVLLDLEAGAAPLTLEHFLAAERSVLVLQPEPAAVECAHAFIRRLFARELEAILKRHRDPAAADRGQDRILLSCRPAEAVARLQEDRPAAAESLVARLKTLRIHLVLNQVRHVSDLEVGVAFKRVVEAYFGLAICFSGAIWYDAEAWLSARRRRLRVRESSGSSLGEQLELCMRHLIDGTELDLPAVIPPL